MVILFGSTNVYVYGVTPPLTDTCIDPSVLEQVDPLAIILTDDIPWGDVKNVPATKEHNAASVTWTK